MKVTASPQARPFSRTRSGDGKPAIAGCKQKSNSHYPEGTNDHILSKSLTDVYGAINLENQRITIKNIYHARSVYYT